MNNGDKTSITSDIFYNLFLVFKKTVRFIDVNFIGKIKNKALLPFFKYIFLMFKL